MTGRGVRYVLAMRREQRYGYTFLDRRRQPLESLAQAAEALGYQVVSLAAPIFDPDVDADQWTLQLARIATRDEAPGRTHELAMLGKLLDVEIFDGVSVAA